MNLSTNKQWQVHVYFLWFAEFFKHLDIDKLKTIFSVYTRQIIKTYFHSTEVLQRIQFA